MSDQPTKLRYVVLRHDGIDNPHFDLMFETAVDGTLATWRSPSWPLQPNTPMTKLADHRRDYLQYEGPLSGNRGAVTRVAEGTYQLLFLRARVWHIELDQSGARGEWMFALDDGDKWHARYVGP